MFTRSSCRSAEACLIRRHARGMTFGEWLLVLFSGAILLAALMAFFMPATRVVRPAAMQTQCRNQLRQIGLALAAYNDDYGRLPPVCTTDAAGKPLHSWRTLLLPYLDHRDTYYRLDLSKPWDDPANARLLERIPVSVFRCPGAKLDGRHDTTYLALRTPDNQFRVPVVRSFTERAAGLPELLIVVEVDMAHAVPWMSPQDADPALFRGIDSRSKLSHPKGTFGLFANGVVQHFAASQPVEERQKTLEQGQRPPTPVPDAK